MSTNSSSTTTKAPRVDYNITGPLNTKHSGKISGAVQGIKRVLTYYLTHEDPADEMGFSAGTRKFTLTIFKTPDTAQFPGRNFIIGRGPSIEETSFLVTIRYKKVLFTGCLRVSPMDFQLTQRIHEGLKTLARNGSDLATALSWQYTSSGNSATNASSGHEEQAVQGSWETKSGFPILSTALEVAAALQPHNGYTTKNNRGASDQQGTHSTNRLTASPTLTGTPHGSNGSKKPSDPLQSELVLATPAQEPSVTSPAEQNETAEEKHTGKKSDSVKPEFSDEILGLFLLYAQERANQGRGWKRCITQQELNGLRDEFLAAHDTERFRDTPKDKRGVYLGRFFHMLEVKPFIHQHRVTLDWYLSKKGGKLIGAEDWETLLDSEIKKPVGVGQRGKTPPTAAAPEPTQTPDSIVDVLKAKLQELVGQKDLNEKEIDRLTAQNVALGDEINGLEEKLRKAEASQATLRELEERMKREREAIATLIASLNGNP
jgi:hypothetical protein